MQPIHEEAAKEFAATVMEIQEQITDLADYFENDMDEDVALVNWGHVGTAKHILHMLEEVKAAAGLSDAE